MKVVEVIYTAKLSIVKTYRGISPADAIEDAEDNLESVQEYVETGKLEKNDLEIEHIRVKVDGYTEWED